MFININTIYINNNRFRLHFTSLQYLNIKFVLILELEMYFGKSARMGDDKNKIAGPGSYRIPCSIVDVNDYTRAAGKFDPQFRYDIIFIIIFILIGKHNLN